MKNFSVPFTIGTPNTKDYALEKRQAKIYRLIIPAGKKLTEPILISFGSGTGNLDLKLEIEIGKKAEAVIKILAKSTGAQNLSINAELICDEAESKGEILMKGMADGHSRLSFDGLVRVGKNAAGSTAYLKQEILNLSPYTSVRAKPGLKIETNDVKAGHSAWVRNLNDEDLYYFAARGIESETAKKLLVTAFFENELKEQTHFKTACETIPKLL